MIQQAAGKLPIEALFDGLGCTIRQSDALPDLSHFDPIEVSLLLKRCGVVALRGFDLDLERFKIFTERFPSRFLTHLAPSLRPTLSKDRTVAGVLKGNGWIYLHGEMYYMPRRPDELWLYCTVPPSEGGETTFLDAPSFLEALSPGARTLFEKRRVRYRYIMKKEQWQEAFATTDVEVAVEALKQRAIVDLDVRSDHTIEYRFITSAIKTFPNGSRGFINSIANLRQYGSQSVIEFEDGAAISDDLVQEIVETGEGRAYLHKWQQNDILLLDNRWILHGRRAFDCPRAVATRFSVGTEN